MRKLKDILEIILFVFVLILISIIIISVIIALAAMLSFVGVGRFIIAILAVLAIIIVTTLELKKTDIPVIDCSNCYKDNQRNRDIACFLRAYYPDKFYHGKLTDDDWTTYALLTNDLNGVGFTVDCNRELFEKLAKNLEEMQMINTELYRKVKEDLKK